MGAYEDARQLWVDNDHIHWTWRATGQPFVLSDREHFDSLVISDEVPAPVVNPALLKLFVPEVRAMERLLVISRHKTNLLTVHFIRNFHAHLPGDGADFILGHSAERGDCAT